MANSLSLSSLFLVLSLWAFHISPAHSLTCSSQTFSNNKRFTTCLDLPVLNSYLHYTYNASNSSLSIAFVSTPPQSEGWVAWAINPKALTMIGSQSLIAIKSNGSVSVNTYNISTYNVVPSKLSFDVWDLSAVSNTDGSIVIFGGVKVPEKEVKLNQVWQVGPLSNGSVAKHAMDSANMNSKNELRLVGSSTESPAPAPSPTSGGPSSGGGSSGGAPPPEKAGGSRIGKNSIVGLVLGLVLLIGSF